LFAPFQEGGGVPVSLGSCALGEEKGIFPINSDNLWQK
jgi:hypothetical protein